MPHTSAPARLFGCLFSATALALTLGGCANKPTDTGTSTTGGGSASNAIVIGEFAAMTGDQATFGSSTDDGVQLAANELNKAGGINGVQVAIHREDDQSDPDMSLTVVKKLITEDKAMAILGEVASKNSISAAPFCNTNHIPMISPSSTNPKVTLTGPYIFRVCFIDPFQGTVGARFATQTLHAKTAAVLYDQTSDYSNGLQGFFQKSFTSLGGKVVAVRTYEAKDTDFRSSLTTIKAANPDIIYVPGYYNAVGTIARQARALGITAPLVGGDGWESPKLLEGAGGGEGKISALEGCYFTDHSSLDEKDPVVKKFVEAYKTAYNVKDVDALSAQGYDAANVLFAAMKAAGKPDGGDYNSDAYRAKVRDAIAATANFHGATGIITLDADRNAKKPAVVLQIKGNNYKNVVATFQP
jgi:branched-chain amino acid transport system substrate-binding protein